MITRREMNATLGASLVALLSGSVASLRAEAAAPAQATKQNAPSGAGRAIPTLLQESIGNLGDAEATMLILNIPPRPAAGHTARPFPTHKHPGPVFAYVLEGSVENQVDPQGKPKAYKTGDYWYEPAMHVHRLLRNLSDTHPAKVLVFEVTPKGQPLGLPAK
jgi:hypothetical protein